MRRAWQVLLAAAALLAASVAAAAAPPQPDATAYVLVDAGTGVSLAGVASQRQLPMASTTKVMTALLALERAELDDVVTVPPEAAIGGSAADLVVGEEITMDNLLAGLLVASGNDAAAAVAQHVGGSQEAFVRMMNARGRRMGLRDTSFTNPHGLDEAGHHSSARDLVRLARVAMRHPRFRELVASRAVTAPGPGGVGTRFYESKNGLLSIDPNADGIKTGQTVGAGHALVARARRPDLGVTLYLGLIGAPSEERRAQDAKRLFDWGFRQFARPTLVADGTVIGRAPVHQRPGVSVDYRVNGAITAPIRLQGAPIREAVVAPPELRAPVEEGQVVGELVVRQGAHVLGRRELVTVSSASAPSVWDRVRGVVGSLVP